MKNTNTSFLAFALMALVLVSFSLSPRTARAELLIEEGIGYTEYNLRSSGGFALLVTVRFDYEPQDSCNIVSLGGHFREIKVPASMSTIEREYVADFLPMMTLMHCPSSKESTRFDRKTLRSRPLRINPDQRGEVHARILVRETMRIEVTEVYSIPTIPQLQWRSNEK
ncbi:MAG: hypothetical protein RBT63_10895 [Bdellovibrionales bacterium]|jgi:hypothetical protein|nr:hypothetical protein [Bdellovibrionales bacterium]